MTTATLRWTDPKTRVDGSALAAADIASVEISNTHSDGSVELLGSVLSGVQSFTTGVLAVGVNAFTVVVRDTSGHVSAMSNAAVVVVIPTLAAPSAVTDLEVSTDA